jgi:hypothetical protein
VCQHLDMFFLDDTSPDGQPLDPQRNIQPEYQAMSTYVNELNRQLYEIYVDFITPTSPPPTSRKSNPSNPAQLIASLDHNKKRESSEKCTEKRQLAQAIRQRANPGYKGRKHEGSSSTETTHSPTAIEQNQTSQRRATQKRIRYEPEAMRQGPKSARALNVFSLDSTDSSHFIVDNGASHVLFREQDSTILQHVQMTESNESPFAILKTANGALMNSIGRGMLTIKTVTVIAYIFRNCQILYTLVLVYRTLLLYFSTTLL